MPEDIGSAVAEPEISAGEVDTIDTGAETSVEVDSGSEAVSQDGTQPEKTDATASQATAKTPVTLESLAKTHRETLKAIDPSLPGKIRDAVFAQAALTREFPGGLKEAVATRDAVAQYGGLEGLEEINSAVSDYQKLESQYEKAPQEFAKSLAQEGPQSFSAMMPTGLTEWKRVDPEMYTHTMASVMISTLDGHQVSQRLANAWKSATTPELKAEIEQVWNLIEGYRDVAAKQPERRTDPRAEEISQREQDIQAREARLMMAPVQATGDARIKTVAEREMAQSYRWDQTDPDVKDAVMDRIRTELGKTLAKNPAYTGPRDRMKAAGNVEGLKRHTQQYFDKSLPDIVQRVARLFNVKPKNAGNGVKKPVVATAATTKIDQGWVRVAKMPSLSAIDRSKTTEDMAYDGKAILKDGRKVQWA